MGDDETYGILTEWPFSHYAHPTSGISVRARTMIERRFRHDPVEMAWVQAAGCVGVDPELFFPMGPPRLVTSRAALAKAVCVQCSVRAECLEWSLRTAQDAGIWGGLDEEERRELRRGRRRELARMTG